MLTISLCMIVKNEEKTLSNCLNSVKDLVDEIIIVDTGSEDRTKEIAGEFTQNVYDFEWINDFSAARNFSYSKATKDYILWLDADDVIKPEDRVKFQVLKETLDPSVDAVMMKYNVGFDGKGNVTFSYFRERLSKRSCGFLWMEPVHEFLKTSGRIVNSDIGITHAKIARTSSDRNLKIYEELVRSGKMLSPRGTYYYARELKDHGKFKEAIRYFNMFLKSGLGWVEDNISACHALAFCYQMEKRPLEALTTMFQSFRYDLPRGEICCQIGYQFKEQQNYRCAAFWFELASTLKMPESSWGFIQKDYWGYIPFIECAVCYDRLGEYQKAYEFNEKAAAIKPWSPSVLQNRKYFEGRLGKTAPEAEAE